MSLVGGEKYEGWCWNVTILGMEKTIVSEEKNSYPSEWVWNGFVPHIKFDPPFGSGYIHNVVLFKLYNFHG